MNYLYCWLTVDNSRVRSDLVVTSLGHVQHGLARREHGLGYGTDTPSNKAGENRQDYRIRQQSTPCEEYTEV